ncbi:MAG: tripartite tricarboxylate transporter substrate binding protein [Alcaligenaceae bacterium]|nr:tripartite tricarboxylate transporter substrate binding protein [Alcaligenaceae bacterium]
MLAATLSQRLGQQIVVENRGGATGTIGSAAAARRKPDGYTFVYATPDSHCVFPHLYKDVPYDTLKDFSCIAPIGYFQFGLAVHPSFPAKNAQEFMRLVRESPGKYSYGTWGVGSTAQLIMEDFKVRNDLDILHVPYQGTAPQLVGLASGQVAAAILPMQITDGYVKDGKIRMIGLGSAERFSELPDLPTLIEQGMNVDFRSSVGFLGPAGIPADILNRLNQEIRATINEAAVRKNLLAQYVLPQDMSAQAYREFIVAEYARWGDIVKNSRVVIN